MGLQKGHTNNLNGRPKGQPNKTTKEIKEVIIQIVSDNIERIQDDINSLEPKDRLTFIEKLLKYVIAPVDNNAMLPSLEQEKARIASLFPTLEELQYEEEKYDFGKTNAVKF